MQEVIVYIILITVIAYSIYAIVKKLRTKPTSACDDCSGCGIKQEMKKKEKNAAHSCNYTPRS